MTLKKNPWSFAVLYMAISMATEILLIVVVRLRVPEDNRFIAPILLTIPPVLATWIGGYRQAKEFWVNVALTVALTLGLTLAVNALTGIKTGITEPIINRSLAGLIAAAITNRLSASTGPACNGDAGEA